MSPRSGLQVSCISPYNTLLLAFSVGHSVRISIAGCYFSLFILNNAEAKHAHFETFKQYRVHKLNDLPHFSSSQFHLWRQVLLTLSCDASRCLCHLFAPTCTSFFPNKNGAILHRLFYSILITVLYI